MKVLLTKLLLQPNSVAKQVASSVKCVRRTFSDPKTKSNRTSGMNCGVGQGRIEIMLRHSDVKSDVGKARFEEFSWYESHVHSTRRSSPAHHETAEFAHRRHTSFAQVQQRHRDSGSCHLQVTQDAGQTNGTTRSHFFLFSTRRSTVRVRKCDIPNKQKGNTRLFLDHLKILLKQ